MKNARAASPKIAGNDEQPPEDGRLPSTVLSSEVSRGLTVRVKVRVLLAVPYFAVTVNVELPAAVGVPEILPDGSRVRPAGRVPESVHVAPEGFEVRATL